jgi:hypothetical protein
MLWLHAEYPARADTVERLGDEFPDSLPWLEAVATSLSARKWQGLETDDLFWSGRFPEDPKTVKAFQAAEWRSYRKRVPRDR